MRTSLYLSVDYDEAPNTYRAFVLTDLDDVEHRFENGDPVKDYTNMLQYAYELSEKYPGVRMMESSSVNHFVWDVPGYRWDENDMLVLDEKEPTLDTYAWFKDSDYLDVED